MEKCWQENPVLESVGPSHKSACWVDISGVDVYVSAEKAAAQARAVSAGQEGSR